MKKYLFLLTLVLFLSSCAQPIIYTGDKFPKTTTVDVFYSPSEIHKDYKVMGHLISHNYGKEIVKKELARFARSVGADAVIITGTDVKITGKPNRVAAEAVKYK